MKFFKRLFCMHYWVETGIPDPMVFMTGEFIWACTKCGKHKSFRFAPVNYLEP